MLVHGPTAHSNTAGILNGDRGFGHQFGNAQVKSEKVEASERKHQKTTGVGSDGDKNVQLSKPAGIVGWSVFADCEFCCLNLSWVSI